MTKLIPVLLMASWQAFAAGGHGQGHEGIPTVVYWQAANLLIIFAGIIYFVGPKIKETFRVRNQEFLAASEKSKSIQQEAERKLADIQNRLSLLEKTSAESLSRARAEAADLRKQIIAEGQEVAEKIRKEAELVAKVEIENAQRTLHAQVVKDSLQMAQEVLKKDVGQADQQRLQERFSQQIEGVRL
ncbi:MAG: ATP synthase F0 subunit B [Bdellovibrionales bacterium]